MKWENLRGRGERAVRPVDPLARQSDQISTRGKRASFLCMMASVGKVVFVMATMEHDDPLEIRSAILDALGR